MLHFWSVGWVFPFTILVIVFVAKQTRQQQANQYNIEFHSSCYDLLLVAYRMHYRQNLQHKSHQIPKCFSSRLAVGFAQSNEARYEVKNEDVFGAAPTGDAPTTS